MKQRDFTIYLIHQAISSLANIEGQDSLIVQNATLELLDKFNTLTGTEYQNVADLLDVESTSPSWKERS